MKTTLTCLLLLVLCSPPVTAQPESAAGHEGEQHSESAGPRPAVPVPKWDSAGRTADLNRRADSTDGRQRAKNEPKQQTNRKTDRVQFSGQIFTRYGWNSTGTETEKNYNSFALDRWYFTARTALSDDLRFRGTTDIVSPDPEGDAGYTIVVKYAYFDWQVQPDLSLRAGVHQTGWENYVNGVWGYRGTTKTMAHYQGHIATSDLGATLSYTLPGQFGTASVGVHNGGGYRRLETDQLKDVSGQARLTPFADGNESLAPLTLSAHVYRGTHSTGSTRLRWGGLAAYATDGYTLAVNYEARTDGAVDGAGVSTFGTLRIGTLGPVGDISVLGMLNLYDPNEAEGGDRSLRTVMGVAAEPASGLTVTLDYQQVRMQPPASTRYSGERADVDGGLFLHAILNY